jgi:CrcB protein
MTRFLFICLAGALGTGARYAVGLWAGKALGTTFPYATLIVNVAGCFLIALVAETALLTTWISDTTRLTLMTGFMGGLTTYSSFNFETTKLLAQRAYGAAAVNVLVTMAVCFVAGLLGLAVARKIAGGA